MLSQTVIKNGVREDGSSEWNSVHAHSYLDERLALVAAIQCDCYECVISKMGNFVRGGMGGWVLIKH